MNPSTFLDVTVRELQEDLEYCGGVVGMAEKVLDYRLSFTTSLSVVNLAFFAGRALGASAVESAGLLNEHLAVEHESEFSCAGQKISEEVTNQVDAVLFAPLLMAIQLLRDGLGGGPFRIPILLEEESSLFPDADSLREYVLEINGISCA